MLLGPTGSGKTPLGDLLAQKGLAGRRCFHFDFGSQLRRIVSAPKPPQYLERSDVDFLNEVLNSGALLENEHFYIAAGILESFIKEKQMTDEDFLILNGLPRHIDQANDVDAIAQIKAVINLSCTPQIVFERISKDTGGDRAQRTDDDEDFVSRKLDIFNKRVAPLLDHYRELSVRVVNFKITAEDTAKDVWQRINAEFSI